MDGDTARRVINEQDELARRQLWSWLNQQVTEGVSQADARINALASWLGRSWRPDWAGLFKEWLQTGRVPWWRHDPDEAGFFEPGADRALKDTEEWLSRYHSFLFFLNQYGVGLNAEATRVLLPRRDSVGVTVYAREVDDLGHVRRSKADVAIEERRDALQEHARCLRETIANFPTRLLNIPSRDIHPPRHARLHDGVLGRLVTEDLNAHIDTGQALDASLATNTVPASALDTWRVRALDILTGLTADIGAGLMSLTSGATACANPIVATPAALARAYLALGVAYLEEVRERMPDYAEASGQGLPRPEVSITISGGTFHGSQVAAHIANIESSIAGVIQHGDPNLAGALQELAQAVLSEDGVDDEQRQDLLDNVEYLSQAAQSPPESRSRGLIKSVLAALSTAATTGAELGKAMDTWGGVLHKLLS